VIHFFRKKEITGDNGRKNNIDKSGLKTCSPGNKKDERIEKNEAGIVKIKMKLCLEKKSAY
jgi:hypothetical protein